MQAVTIMPAPSSPSPAKPSAALPGAASSGTGLDNDKSGLIGRYSRTSGPGPGARPAGVVFPESTEQVRRLVLEAREMGVPLYPISRGKNWGYGDACAPTDGQIIVDLSRMNRILEVNAELAYVVIEPGVTQGQLYDYLQENQLSLWMDATGAGREASLVGNTVDRGFGHTRYGDHFLTTCGMEVVLGDGRVLNTGFGHYPHAKAHRVYRYGVGPYLDGLFAQSNFGIVTKIGLWLMPRPEDFCAFFFSAPEEGDLAELVDRLAPLRMQGLLQSTMHIGNDLRVLSSRMRYPWERAAGQTPLPEELRRRLRREHGIGAWQGCGAIYGSRATVAATRKAVARAMRGVRCSFLDDSRLARARWISRMLPFGLGRRLGELIDTVEPVYGLLKGIPADEPLHGASWRVRDPMPDRPMDPLDAHAGVIWVSPIVPLQGSAARELMELVEPIYQRHGFDCLATFTMITERAMVCVTNIAFDRRDEAETTRAGACYEELMGMLMGQGLIPYRTGPSGFGKLAEGSNVFWETCADIKRALDPDGVIAPGRYEPRRDSGR